MGKLFDLWSEAQQEFFADWDSHDELLEALGFSYLDEEARKKAFDQALMLQVLSFQMAQQEARDVAQAHIKKEAMNED